jgi:uncharacterized protein with HEPN domain
MRHKVVHDYLTVDFDLVWDVASAEVPVLITQLEAIATSQASERQEMGGSACPSQAAPD